MQIMTPLHVPRPIASGGKLIGHEAWSTHRSESGRWSDEALSGSMIVQIVEGGPPATRKEVVIDDVADVRSIVYYHQCRVPD